MADVRLIDANVLIKDITESVIEVSGDSGLAEEAVRCYQAVILKYIDTIPTINPDDCRPHGRLGEIYVDEYYGDMADCLLCGGWNVPPCNYCSNCGAVMDGKEQGDV